MPLKIAMIGAGSIGFTRRLMADPLTVPEFADTTFAFTDINERNLDMVTQLAERDIKANKLPAQVESVMLIGHNPAMQELTLMLAAEGPELRRVHGKFPTGALATLEFDGDWSALGPHAARLTAFVRPKELG